MIPFCSLRSYLSDRIRAPTFPKSAIPARVPPSDPSDSSNLAPLAKCQNQRPGLSSQYSCDAGNADGPEPCTLCGSSECRRRRR